jgi:hypothetical protein
MSLSDIGSWASIIGLFLSFAAGFGICKITTKKNKQTNEDSSFIKIGDTEQSNVSHQ